MKTQPGLRHRLVGAALAALASTPAIPALQAQGPSIPGGCVDSPNKRSSDVGCYLSAIQSIEKLPNEPVFWHLYSYPTRAAAEAEKSDSSSTVVEAFSKVWLFTIANAQWRPAAGERVAVIGPLPITGAKQ